MSWMLMYLARMKYLMGTGVFYMAIPIPAVPVPFFFYCYADHRDLHSFPTRRSSDLGASGSDGTRASASRRRAGVTGAHCIVERSEEHTSELQSHVNLVCRLLLEK